MGDTPDLDRRWTLADAAAELWARGVSLKCQTDGYHLSYAKVSSCGLVKGLFEKNGCK